MTPGPTQPPIHPNTDYLTTTIANLLQLHGNCTECCPCADYERVYNELKRLWEQAEDLARAVQRQRLKYNRLAELWTLIRDAKEDGIHVKLIPMAGTDYTLSIMWLAYNNTGEALVDPVTIEVELLDAGSKYVEKSFHVDTEGYRKRQTEPVIDGDKYTITIQPLRRAQYATGAWIVRYGADVPDRRNKIVRLKASIVSGLLSDTDEQESALVPPLRKA